MRTALRADVGAKWPQKGPETSQVLAFFPQPKKGLISFSYKSIALVWWLGNMSYFEADALMD